METNAEECEGEGAEEEVFEGDKDGSGEDEVLEAVEVEDDHKDWAARGWKEWTEEEGHNRTPTSTEVAVAIDSLRPHSLGRDDIVVQAGVTC
mmetsp:Transcript_94355/g.266550  ORF Transcript_94355/g.266550 Transcript_94355/m.266550 type:complete len:92 (-) Transcript_94355:281-556(-)